jgi:hypothetical protein
MSTELGEMPEQPAMMSFAKVKGDAGVYEVRAIDWVGCKVCLYRASDWEWHDISKISFVAADGYDQKKSAIDEFCQNVELTVKTAQETGYENVSFQVSNEQALEIIRLLKINNPH